MSSRTAAAMDCESGVAVNTVPSDGTTSVRSGSHNSTGVPAACASKSTMG